MQAYVVGIKISTIEAVLQCSFFPKNQHEVEMCHLAVASHIPIQPCRNYTDVNFIIQRMKGNERVVTYRGTLTMER